MKLYFRKYGNGKPLIILHGLFGSGINWNSVGKILARDYTVYIPDQRNHGKSPHSHDCSYEHLTQDLFAFYSDNGIDNAVLLGHSMGGKVALKFAFEYPQMVEKLIVVDIGIKEYPVKDERLIGAMVNLELGKYTSRKEIEIELGKDIKEESMRLFIMQNLLRTQDHGFSWKMNLDVLSQNTDQVSEAINVSGIFNARTLFISGGQSDYLLPEDRDNLKKNFASVQFDVIANAGHWVHADELELFNNSIAEFLEMP